MSSVRTDTSLIASKIPRYVYVAGVSVVTLGLIAIYMVIHPQKEKIQIPIAEVRYGTVYPYVTVTGTIVDQDIVSISSSAGGQIAKWMVHVGSRVKAGQILAYFSNYSINQEIYEDLRKKYIEAQEIVADDQREEALLEAEQNAANLNAVTSGSRRDNQQLIGQSEQLHSNGLQSPAQEEVQQDQNAINLLSAEEATLQAEQAAIEAKLDMLTALQSLRNSELTSPVNGEITSLQVPAGAQLSPYQEACTLISTTSTDAHAKVVATINAQDVSRVHVGEHVDISSPDISGSFTGTVELISPFAVNQSQLSDYQYQVYIEINHASPQMLNGMSVNCSIYTSPIRHAVIVPADAVMVNNGQLGVYVRDSSGRFKFTPVKILSSDALNVQVQGVKVGMAVATKRPQE
ncbi:efflux RND transporter periplasmic adaptor subunit [Alicyclobacillus acidocaldarius]|uniref:Secretion protein HlyD family protein n=1 Tax=Alicyclobacillus acidocaldarius subsp. acidocaldarius (strain ATCC 27009 / DSM 446 / BCRC 14685 / JCM 5260 / KCTC 1825 / NBRC 15652 / NCIMB 11725 / NRRL B-14509 / 104-IA) TaxID=521098 RepID=C8WWQ7_ALIAD|nr:efflux RND transporter periplasmic adaptor subunit [Alicyclobacillus acidocaldarius]ACV58528.1 secretion protein HlyD family protein [Alicyclobacillus acidocaldarius subsp. acidocaldarius DSM 446]